MDPNPKSYPILSYVMARIPTIGPRTSTGSDFSSVRLDMGQPETTPPRLAVLAASSFGQIVDRMPHLSDPSVLASMTRAVTDVAQTRSVLKTLGDRPDGETVGTAKAKLAEIEANLSKQLGEIVLSPRPVELDRFEWRACQAEKEIQCRQLAEKENAIYKAVIQLDEMYEAYERLLKEADERLVKIYRSAERGEDERSVAPVTDEISEEVVRILPFANGYKMERIDISGRRLRILPEGFGQLRFLSLLNVSSNQLKVIPDSIAGLENLEELNASSNLLESLPDSVGLLQNLKFLNVSGNKLNYLPDSICQCRSLVELDVSFNNLTYLPIKIGYELVKLRKLSVQLNKLSFLPTSVCEMRSVRHLDAHFNELRGLPLSIGRLVNLEVLNVSSNFSELKELPDTLGDLTNLKELNLSNNQIHALPDTFGRLDNLVKLNLDQNPIEIPPLEVVKEGLEAVKVYMAKRWLGVLVEEEKKGMLEERETGQTGWLTRSTSWLKDYTTGVTEYLTSPRTPRTPRTPRDPFLDQQL